MGPALGAPKVGTCNFWEIQYGQLQPYSSPKKKVQKTKKFCLIELQLKCSKIFGLRSNPGELRPKTIFQEFCPLKQTVSKDDLSMPIFSPMGDFFEDFGIKAS